MKKYILVSTFFLFTLLNLSSIEMGREDSVIIRKLFFFDSGAGVEGKVEKDWASYIDKKQNFPDNFGLICILQPPQYIISDIFENDILPKIKETHRRNSLVSSYKRAEKSKYYLLDDNVSNKSKNILRNILIESGYKRLDYFFIFYKQNPDFERMYSKIDEDLRETYTYGKISYLFDYEKTLKEVKVYFQENNNSYLYFSSLNKDKFDVYLFGKPYKRHLSYNFDFDSLRFLDLNTILNVLYRHNLSKETLIETDDQKTKEEFVSTVINPSLAYKYVDDGARNELGEFVYISNNKLQSSDKKGFNCSGFIKDVIDNYIRYKQKDFKWIPLDELLKRRTEEREITSYTFYEKRFDPYFGLEWTKNLIDRLNYYYGYKERKASLYDKDKYSNVFENGDYDFKHLKEILFRDQQSDSNSFYIVVFNKFKKTPPSIPSYYHSAVVVPYFEDKHFYIRVFESGEETSYDNLVKYHYDEKVVIFKIPVPFF